MISEGDFNSLTAGSILSHDTTFESSQKRQSNKVNKIEAFTGSDLQSGYKFASSTESELLTLLESGTISKSVYEQQLQLARETEMRNLGYCFITFSHSDEAKLMLIQNKDCYMMGQKLHFDLKSNVDHSELDYDFFINRARNDSKLIDEIKRLREAKEELRKFESEIDSHLPKSQKLKEFREFSKNLIENEEGLIRGSASSTRTKDEEERLR
jgi:RNA recognition motif-containing protein